MFSRRSSSTESDFYTNKIVSEDPFKIERSKQFSVRCGYHRGFDVHSSQNLFAVVAEAKPPDVHRKVLLYKRPAVNYETVDAVGMYTSPFTHFQPADVCSFTLRGQEVKTEVLFPFGSFCF